MIIFAPDGIGEITAGTDIATAIIAATADSDHGPLIDGDIVVVTSKIISKQEGRTAPETQKPTATRAETRRVVARRGAVRIVQNQLGITQAAAGIDSSNVEPGTILLLPLDPDASAERLRTDVARLAGVEVAVIISDTSGRAWREGQTDHAIGVAGSPALLRYAGREDAYGNPLMVTQMAVADEIAAAADLVKGKLGGRPVAVVRGLEFDQPPEPATALLRQEASDLFRLGTREAVIEAVLRATGRAATFEDVVELDGAELVSALTAGLPPELARFVRALLEPQA